MKKAAVALSLLLILASPVSTAADIKWPISPLASVLRAALCRAGQYNTLVFLKTDFGNSLLADTLAGPGSSIIDSYGLKLTRVGGVTGAAFHADGFGTQNVVPWNVTVDGTWGWDSRHHYTKDSPWNADGSLFLLQNPTTTNDSAGNFGITNPASSGTSGGIILRTTDWSVTSYGNCKATGDSIRDLQWMPTNPSYMLVLKQFTNGNGMDSTCTGAPCTITTDANGQGGDYLGILDVTTCQIIRRTPIHQEAGGRMIKCNLLGAGEGQATTDGSKFLLHTLHRQNNWLRPDTLQVVNLNTMALGTPYEIPPCSLDVEASADGSPDCNIGHATLSPDGTKIVVLYAADDAPNTSVGGTTHQDACRVFDVSGTTITGPHTYAIDSLNMAGTRTWCAVPLLGGGTQNAYGWIASQKHASTFSDPFTGHDALAGAHRCGKSGQEGALEMVDLQTGRMKRLSAAQGITESSVVHVSATNSKKTGYVLISYDDANGSSPYAEVVLYKTDGLGKLVRLANHRTRDTGHIVAAYVNGCSSSGTTISSANAFTGVVNGQTAILAIQGPSTAATSTSYGVISAVVVGPPGSCTVTSAPSPVLSGARMSFGSNATSSNYRSEAHPVFSFDAKKVAFNSDWRFDCTNCGVGGVNKAYVLDLSTLCFP